MYLLPSILVFKDAQFGPSLNSGAYISLPQSWGYGYVGDDWNDSISSVIVLSGTWQFFEHAGFQGAFTTVGPGWYQFVEDPQFNMQNDTISSILCISDQPQGDNPVADV
jgi:Beta/Gamma crystallin